MMFLIFAFLNKQGFEKVEPEFVVSSVFYKYANLHMYTIFSHMRIVRMASVKTMYVRPMIAMKGEWKKKVNHGGFYVVMLLIKVIRSGLLFQDQLADAITIRRQKDGSWKSKWSSHPVM